MVFEIQWVEVGSQKSIKNRSKNGIQDGMHHGMDFSQIFADFGCYVGIKNPPKIGLTGVAWRHGVAWKA